MGSQKQLMKEEELRQRYQRGQRDFSQVNLRRENLANQDWSGAKFTGADLRGTVLTGSQLVGCDFSHVQAGLDPKHLVGMVILVEVLLLIAGVVAVQAGIISLSTLTAEFMGEYTLLPAGIVFLAELVLVIVTLKQGIPAGALAATVTISLTIPLAGLLGPILYRKGTLAGTGPVGLAVASCLLSVVVGAIATGSLRALISSPIGIRWLERLSFLLCLSAGGLTWRIMEEIAQDSRRTGAIAKSLKAEGQVPLSLKVTAILMAAIIWGLGRLVGLKAILGVNRFAFTRTAAVGLAASMGTQFRGANLNQASFRHAFLSNTDFREAMIAGTDWLQAEGLALARLGQSYLQEPKVRDLVLTRQGSGQNFDGLDLSGINLTKANLKKSSFVRANLNQATLAKAQLTNARLIQTQLDGTDLSGAYLTGVCIQDWGITTTTCLDGVVCRYVYLRWSTAEHSPSSREPDNGEVEFKPGEFEIFMAPLKETLDLYHNQKVDPRAIAAALAYLVKENPEARLELIAMEKRGQSKFLIKMKTAAEADRSQLSQDYFALYNQRKRLPVSDLPLEDNNRYQSLITFYEGISCRSSEPIHEGHRAINPLDDWPDSRQIQLKKLLERLEILVAETPEMSALQRACCLEQLAMMTQVAIYPQAWPKKPFEIAIGYLIGICLELPKQTKFALEGKALIQDLSQLIQQP